VQRARQQRAQPRRRRRLPEPEDEVAERLPVEPRAQQADEQTGREREERELGHPVRQLLERPGRDRARERDREHDQRAGQDRRECAPARRGRPAPPAQEAHEHQRRDQHGAGGHAGVHRVGDAGVGRDREHVRRAVRAVRRPRLLVGQRAERVRHGEDVDRDERGALEPVLRTAGRERRKQVREQQPLEALDEHAEGVRQTRLDVLELAHQPGEADRDHQQPGAAARPARGRDDPGGDEAPADHDLGDRIGGRLAQVTPEQRRERDQPAGRAGERDCDPPRPRAHRAASSSARRRLPLSCSLAMNPAAGERAIRSP
jgi:hypothetical protein